MTGAVNPVLPPLERKSLALMVLIYALFERLTRRIRKPFTARWALLFHWILGLDTLPACDHRHISILKLDLSVSDGV